MTFLDPYSRTPLLIQLIIARKKLNKDTILVFCGEKRSGKSWAALKLLEKLDPTFDPSKQVFFKPVDFLRWQARTRGSYALLDEASNFASSSRWWEAKPITKAVEQGGYKNNTLIFTLPNLSALESHVRRNVHVLGILWGGSRGAMTCYRNKHNQLMDKTYSQPFCRIQWQPPKDETVKIYEQMKDEMVSAHLQSDVDEIEYYSDGENFSKRLPLSFYQRGFQSGFIDQQTFQKNLERKGFSSSDIEMVLKIEELEKFKTATKKQIEGTANDIKIIQY